MLAIEYVHFRCAGKKPLSPSRSSSIGPSFQATLTYGGAAARLTAIILLFIGVREKKHRLLIPHLMVQVISFVALSIPVWNGINNPHQSEVSSALTDPCCSNSTAAEYPPPSSTLLPHPDQRIGLTFILCAIALGLEMIFFSIILHAFVELRRINARQRSMTAAEALLNSINNQWRCSSNNLSSCVYVEMYPHRGTEEKRLSIDHV